MASPQQCSSVDDSSGGNKSGENNQNENKSVQLNSENNNVHVEHCTKLIIENMNIDNNAINEEIILNDSTNTTTDAIKTFALPVLNEGVELNDINVIISEPSPQQMHQQQPLPTPVIQLQSESTPTKSKSEEVTANNKINQIAVVSSVANKGNLILNYIHLY